MLQSRAGRGVLELEPARSSEAKKTVVKHAFFKGKNSCCVARKRDVAFFEINFALQIYKRLYTIHKARKSYVKRLGRA